MNNVEKKQNMKQVLFKKRIFFAEIIIILVIVFAILLPNVFGTVENRWKFLLDGFKVTLSLAVLSAIFGTLLGIIICAMRMSNNTFFIAFTNYTLRYCKGLL